VTARDRLTDELERALLLELAAEHRRQSAVLFRDQLAPVVVRLVDGDGKLGEWDLATRTISFSRRFVVDAPWAKVVEVLKHEMAHQYAHEVLGAVDEPAHGPAFRRACDERGIDPAAAGLPDGDDDDDRVLRKVAKLLALAGSDNAHEAESAMQKAHKLMLEHAIDQARLDADRGRVFLQLGAPKARVPRHEKILAHILVTRFHVQAILVPAFSVADGARGHVLEICGANAHVATAAYVHDFLLRTAESLWREHKRAHGVAGDRDRLRFLAGVLRGFDEKLAASERALAAQGLVYAGDAKLDDWFHRRHPRIRRTRVAAQQGHAHEHGRRAGRDIVLHKPLEGTTSRGRLLG
jgi:hypothetical protein